MQDSLPDLTAWRAVEVEDSQTRHKSMNAAQHEYSTSYSLMNSSTQAHDQYGSCTSSFAGNTHAAVTASSSTSGSSHGDQYSNSSSATRLAASSVSPEVLSCRLSRPPFHCPLHQTGTVPIITSLLKLFANLNLALSSAHHMGTLHWILS